ncbi:ATP sulfurylase (sulfate adenylyltransferase) [Thermoplasmatales archaeon SCGC AB-539-C06]|nr:ATP sulfurylase (sulfate adenylyltransferase) [Thermoplasmatales archaeon SCGC AB-539-C06]
MSKPHGGKLINRLVKKESSDVDELPKLEINTDLSEDVLNISKGVFSPLEGFLYDNDLESVVKEKRLADDTPWTIPILLDFDKQDIKDLKEGDAVLLNKQRKRCTCTARCR